MYILGWKYQATAFETWGNWWAPRRRCGRTSPLLFSKGAAFAEFPVAWVWIAEVSVFCFHANAINIINSLLWEKCCDHFFATFYDNPLHKSITSAPGTVVFAVKPVLPAVHDQKPHSIEGNWPDIFQPRFASAISNQPTFLKSLGLRRGYSWHIHDVKSLNW